MELATKGGLVVSSENFDLILELLLDVRRKLLDRTRGEVF
jgi:hypothetical protein